MDRTKRLTLLRICAQGKNSNVYRCMVPVFMVLYAVLRAIIAFIAYLVIGGLVMYFAKGARGIEVIPNITFWKDLPFLLKVNLTHFNLPLYNCKYAC